VGQLVTNVKTLSDAGWEIDGAELSEKTGYTLVQKQATTERPLDADKNSTTETEDAKAAAGEDPAAADEDAAEAAASKNRAKTPNDSGFSQTDPAKKAAAALLAGFGDLATIFLEQGDEALAPVIEEALEEVPSDPSAVISEEEEPS
jgi:hypothetical protein